MEAFVHWMLQIQIILCLTVIISTGGSVPIKLETAHFQAPMFFLRLDARINVPFVQSGHNLKENIINELLKV